MSKEEVVSTIIPTYKRSDMLPRAIESVLNQSYNNIEVIVVDDNNPNSEHRKSTEEIMKKFEGNARVKYIKHDKNRNGSVARNTGIKYAIGKYICFLDDDNYFYPTKIEKQYEYMLANPEFKAAYCGWKVGDETVIPYKTGDLTYEQFLGSNIIDTNMIIMETFIAKQFGGWDERLKRNQDVAFILKYFKMGYKIGLVKEELVFIDLVDRLNVANPRENEKNFDDFLKFYDDQIEALENKNAKKNIYSFRYRGVFLNYLKYKDFKGALCLYAKMLRFAPIIFNKDLISGFIKKVKGKPLFSMEE